MSRALFAIACFVAVAACGRLNFGATDPGGDGGDGGSSGDGSGAITDALPSTGPTGARYLIALDSNPRTPVIAGSNGAVAVVEVFQGATTIAGRAFVGQATLESDALVWLDPSGASAAVSVMDSPSRCEIRALGPVGTSVVGVGYTQAGTTVPAEGACALATGRQDGVAVAVDPTGAQSLAAHVIANSVNVQTWFATGFDDGTIAVSGVYGGSPTLGTTVLPAAGSDENPYYARVDPSTGDARWVQVVQSADEIEAGPIDAFGSDLCMAGSFINQVIVLGSSLTTAPFSTEAWIARVDGNGNPRFVRSIVSAGGETISGNVSIAATGDGGCVIAANATGDLTIDGVSLPVSAGPAVVLRFDNTGTLAAGTRTPARLAIARLSDSVYGAVPCTAPCTIAGAPYTPAGNDIVFVAFDAQVRATVIGALETGATALEMFAAIAPDALAVSFTAGAAPTAFGPLSLSPTTPVNALAVLGVVP